MRSQALLEGTAYHPTRLQVTPRRDCRLAAQAPVAHEQPVRFERPTGVPVTQPSVRGGGWYQEEPEETKGGLEDEERYQRGGEGDDHIQERGPEYVTPEGAARERLYGWSAGELWGRTGQELLNLVAGQKRKEHCRDTRVLAVTGALHAQGAETERLA